MSFGESGQKIEVEHIEALFNISENKMLPPFVGEAIIKVLRDIGSDGTEVGSEVIQVLISLLENKRALLMLEKRPHMISVRFVQVDKT